MSRRLVLLLVALLALAGLFLVLRPGAAPEGPRARTFEIDIRGGRMSPPELTVREGDQVTLRITADERVGFHLHGYDLKSELQPGVPATLTLQATLTGRFDIEDERTETELGTLVVQPHQAG